MYCVTLNINKLCLQENTGHRLSVVPGLKSYITNCYSLVKINNAWLFFFLCIDILKAQIVF